MRSRQNIQDSPYGDSAQNEKTSGCRAAGRDLQVRRRETLKKNPARIAERCSVVFDDGSMAVGITG